MRDVFGFTEDRSEMRKVYGFFYVRDTIPMILGNAINFNGKWPNPFNENETRYGKFCTTDE